LYNGKYDEIRRRRGLTATARYATRINVMRDRGDTRASSVNVMQKSFIDVRLFRVSCSLFSNPSVPSLGVHFGKLPHASRAPLNLT
jgi:hypothetical protein